jgi:hypothetical protein
VERRKTLIQALGRIDFPEGLRPAPVEGDLAEAADAALQRLSELQEQLKAAEKEAAFRQPWGDFSTEKMEAIADAGVPLRFHISPAKAFKPEWADEYAVQVINEMDGKVYYVVAGPDILPDSVRTPKGPIDESVRQITDIKADIDRQKAVLLTVKQRQDELEAESRESPDGAGPLPGRPGRRPRRRKPLVTRGGLRPLGERGSGNGRLRRLRRVLPQGRRRRGGQPAHQVQKQLVYPSVPGTY